MNKSQEDTHTLLPVRNPHALLCFCWWECKLAGESSIIAATARESYLIQMFWRSCSRIGLVGGRKQTLEIKV